MSHNQDIDGTLRQVRGGAKGPELGRWEMKPPRGKKGCLFTLLLLPVMLLVSMVCTRCSRPF